MSDRFSKPEGTDGMAENMAGDGVGDGEVHDAETELAALAANYGYWAREQLSEAEQALEAARGMGSGREPEVQKIFSILHDMKGQGTTFGYDLITLIGGLLCDFIRHIPDATDAELKVVDIHLAAMAIVLDKKIKGSGGDFAEKIQTKLEGIIVAGNS